MDLIWVDPQQTVGDWADPNKFSPLVTECFKTNLLAKGRVEISKWNSQCISSMKLFSLGLSNCVFSAWHVNTEFKSLRCTDGHNSRFSITSPELCSFWLSTSSPFTSQRTCGCGRPRQTHEKGKRMRERNVLMNDYISLCGVGGGLGE